MVRDRRDELLDRCKGGRPQGIFYGVLFAVGQPAIPGFGKIGKSEQMFAIYDKMCYDDSHRTKKMPWFLMRREQYRLQV